VTRRAVVTGASGFVGSVLARTLVDLGHEVHLILRPGHQPWRLRSLGADVRRHEAGLDDREALKRTLRAVKPDWLFHLAAHGAYPQQTDLDRMIATNFIGTVNLLLAALEVGFEAFVNTGSSSEYGFKDHAASEADRLDPNSHYAITKASATLFCRHTAVAHGVPLTTLRLYSVYGPFEEPTRLMPTLAVQGLRGRLPALVDPRTARDYVYVEDAVEAHLLAASTAGQEPGAIYNVGTGHQTSLAEVVQAARRVMSIEAVPQWGSMAPRGWDTSTWVADSSLIHDRLGWGPRHTFQEGFELLVTWLQDDPDMLRHYEAVQAAAQVAHVTSPLSGQR
jgi:nucleoside-diphosphate-sugar epimerase